MKKHLALLLLLLLLCNVFILSSCEDSKHKENDETTAIDQEKDETSVQPKLDLEFANKALKFYDYSVTYVEDSDEPGIVSYLSARKQIEGDEWGYYTVYIVQCEKADTANIVYKQAKLNFDQEIEAIELEIELLENILSEYKDQLKSNEITMIEDEIKDYRQEIKEYKEKYVVGKSGKFVWYGDTKAIEDTHW